MALLGAALLLLDFAATAIVSAAAAASYLAGEVSLPFPVYAGAILVLVVFGCVSLSGLRESARVAAGVLAMHVSFAVSFTFLLLIIRWEQGRGDDYTYRGLCYFLGTEWDGSAQFQLVKWARWIVPSSYSPTVIQWRVYWDAWTDWI